MSDDNVEFVATCSRSWGRGEFKTDAIEKMAANYHGNSRDEETVKICKVKNFNRINGYAVFADEILDETEYLVDGDMIGELQDILGRAERLAEEIMIESEEVNDNE